MTGFDETVPPEPDPSSDGTSTQDTDDRGGDDNVVAPEGGPEALEADGEDAPPMGGDDDIASGHLDG